MTETASGVTCIIPTHSRPDFLGEAIDSVLRQTVTPARIIVVSDIECSDSEHVVAERAEANPVPLVYVTRKGRPGASASRNAGAAQAGTELLAFLDDDDVWEPDYLASALPLLSRGSTAATVSSFYRFDGSGKTGENHPREGQTAESAFRRSPVVTGSTIVIRASAFLVLSGYDEDLPVMNDTDFFLRFLENGFSYVVLRQPLVGVRKHAGGQLTDNTRRRFDGGWEFIRKHEKKFGWRAARPRKYYQYRMLWRMKDASAVERGKALLNILLFLSRSPRS